MYTFALLLLLGLGNFLVAGQDPAQNAAPCVDKTNPSTGKSDCYSLAYLCDQDAYRPIMTQQCPKTCGRCSS
uniref:ShKT domain-containing protein n=1 Tax=Acrobeloides nanus TaxID=290746 RepID=A0A914D4L9_9BILA